jgi:peptidoglycan/LPS O-acetylase OafA/YrhL
VTVADNGVLDVRCFCYHCANSAVNTLIARDGDVISGVARDLLPVTEHTTGPAPILPLPVLTWSSRIPALDGLRGIAILLVLMRHSIFGMQTSSTFLSKVLAVGQLTWSGVDLFFVLSGFLIGGLLLDARQSPRYFQTFYIRRAYRIFPLYGAITALFLLRHLRFHFLPGSFEDFSPLTIPWWSYVTLTQNFWMVLLGWFGPTAMAATWSLAVEEQFYLTIPLLVRMIRPKNLLFVLLSVVAAAPLLRILLRQSIPHGDLACYVLMPCRADSLCLGVLSAMLVRNGRAWNLLLVKRKLLYGLTVALFGGAVFMTYRGYSLYSPFMTTVGYSWLALFYMGCLLIAVSASARGLTRSVLCSPTLGTLGTLAYCSYLIHAPMIQAARRLLELRFSPPTAWLSGGMFGIALTLAVAALSWKFFEKPLLRRGHTHTY